MEGWWIRWILVFASFCAWFPVGCSGTSDEQVAGEEFNAPDTDRDDATSGSPTEYADALLDSHEPDSGSAVDTSEMRDIHSRDGQRTEDAIDAADNDESDGELYRPSPLNSCGAIVSCLANAETGCGVSPTNPCPESLADRLDGALRCAEDPGCGSECSFVSEQAASDWESLAHCVSRECGDYLYPTRRLCAESRCSSSWSSCIVSGGSDSCSDVLHECLINCQFYPDRPQCAGECVDRVTPVDFSALAELRMCVEDACDVEPGDFVIDSLCEVTAVFFGCDLDAKADCGLTAVPYDSLSCRSFLGCLEACSGGHGNCIYKCTHDLSSYSAASLSSAMTCASAACSNADSGDPVGCLVAALKNDCGSWWADCIAGAETDCADGTDNDDDGLMDCADSDCFYDVACEPAQSAHVRFVNVSTTESPLELRFLHVAEEIELEGLSATDYWSFPAGFGAVAVHPVQPLSITFGEDTDILAMNFQSGRFYTILGFNDWFTLESGGSTRPIHSLRVLEEKESERPPPGLAAYRFANLSTSNVLVYDENDFAKGALLPLLEPGSVSEYEFMHPNCFCFGFDTSGGGYFELTASAGQVDAGATYDLYLVDGIFGGVLPAEFSGGALLRSSGVGPLVPNAIGTPADD